MTADNDIVDVLHDYAVGNYGQWSLAASKGADEIVRLRGEVAEIDEWVRERLPASFHGMAALDVMRLILEGGIAAEQDLLDTAALAPAEANDPAPAMPNGVEGLVQNFLDKEVHPTVRDWENRNLAGISILKHWRDFLISLTHAADNRDAAGVDPEEDAYVIERMGKLLAEIAVIVNGPEPDMTRWSYHDLPEKVRALKTAPAPVPAGEAVAYSVVQVGNRGAAYDPPNTHRAFTYEHQPGNIDASRLGRATNAAAVASAGDSIDRGLSLLKELQALGFGVFQIGPPAPVQAAPQVQVNPCKCIDCGGDEPGHSSDCTYMADLHGEAARPSSKDKVRELLREAGDTVEASTVEDGISDNRRLYRIELAARIKAALAQPQSEEAS